MASIKDVAKLAGVGIGTASRALSGNGYVAPATRKKIEDAARQLDYTPNVLAQNLLKNRSGIIGVLIPSLDHYFFSELAQRLESDLYKKGYKTMICCTKNQENGEQDYLDMLENNLVDGIITATHSFNDQAYTDSKRVIVSFDRDFKGRIPMVCSDHEKAGRMAAVHFVESGCKKILSIYGKDTIGGHISTGKAHQVLKEELEKAGISVTEVCTEAGIFDMEACRRTAGECLEKYPEADGVFASDSFCVPFLFQAAGMAIAVPEKLKLITYDATDITRTVHPRLSGVGQRIEEISQILTETLIKKIQGEEVKEKQVLDVYWQDGGTCL